MSGKKSKTDLGITSISDFLNMDLRKLQNVETNEKDLKSYAQTHAFDITREPDPGDVLLYCQDEEIGSRGNIITITGLAKSRKTVVMSAIVSSVYREDKYWLGFKSDLKPNDVILHLDTEQSYRHYYKAVTRIFNDSGISKENLPDTFKSYHTRDADINFRLDLFEYLLEQHKPAIAIIDGVTDFVYDINSQDEAVRVGEKLLAWTSKYNCLIVAIIHTTKGKGHMTGAIGTYLEKKCESALKVEKPDDQPQISNVICHMARDNGFPTFTIRMNNEAHHYEIVPETEVATKGKGGKKDPELYPEDVHRQVLTKMFLVSNSATEDEIVRKVATFAKEVTNDQLGQVHAKRWVKYYNDKAWIACTPDNTWIKVAVPSGEPKPGEQPTLDFSGSGGFLKRSEPPAGDEDDFGDEPDNRNDDLPF